MLGSAFLRAVVEPAAPRSQRLPVMKERPSLKVLTVSRQLFVHRPQWRIDVATDRPARSCRLSSVVLAWSLW